LGETKEKSVKIKIDGREINGDLSVSSDAKAIVVFAHGSGSSRFSPRNKFVACELNKVGLATLLIDLLTEEEEKVDAFSSEFRFDIGFLAMRLARVTSWVRESPLTNKFKIGYFGSSTGAAAALVAAAKIPEKIYAVVSRGGRPDLAKDALSGVKAPTLLIVGENDFEVIEMNQSALDVLKCEKKMEIVPKATHLFEEPGALEHVAKLAAKWFSGHAK